MNLMDLFIKISVKDEASKEVDSISSRLRGGISSATMAAGAAIGSVAAATGVLGRRPWSRTRSTNSWWAA